MPVSEEDVHVPANRLNLKHETVAVLQLHVDPLAEKEKFGKESTAAFLETHMQSEICFDSHVIVV